MEEGAEAHELPRVQVRHLLHHTLHVTPSTLELEEFHQEAFPTSTSAPLATSPVVAAILREAITEVAVRQSLTVGRLVGQVAVDIRYKVKVVERQVEVGREALEGVNSFRPDVPLSFAVDKMDQVDLDSGSEEEVKETVVISDNDIEEVEVLEGRRGVKGNKDDPTTVVNLIQAIPTTCTNCKEDPCRNGEQTNSPSNFLPGMTLEISSSHWRPKYRNQKVRVESLVGGTLTFTWVEPPEPMDVDVANPYSTALHYTSFHFKCF